MANEQGELFNGASYTDSRRETHRAVAPEPAPTVTGMQGDARSFSGRNEDPNQPFLFATVKDLHDRNYVPNHADIGITDMNNARRRGVSPYDAMYARKSAEAMVSGAYDSIKKDGVRQPIGLLSGMESEERAKWGPQPAGENIMMNGGHRVAVEEHIQATSPQGSPERYLPVHHRHEIYEALKAGESAKGSHPLHEGRPGNSRVEAQTDDHLDVRVQTGSHYPDRRFDEIHPHSFAYDYGHVQPDAAVEQEAPELMKNSPLFMSPYGGSSSTSSSGIPPVIHNFGSSTGRTPTPSQWERQEIDEANVVNRSQLLPDDLGDLGFMNSRLSGQMADKAQRSQWVAEDNKRRQDPADSLRYDLHTDSGYDRANTQGSVGFSPDPEDRPSRSSNFRSWAST